MEPDDVARIDDELTRLVRRVRHPEVRRVLTAGVDDPLDRAPHVVLARIEAHEPVRLSRLAALLDVDVSTVSRQVKGLLGDELVAKSSDPVDGRAQRLTVTTRGRQRLEAMRTARHRGLARVMADWPADDARRLGRLLARLHDDLEVAASRDR